MRKILLEIAEDKRNDLLVLLLRPFLYILSLVYGFIVFLARVCYSQNIFPGYRPRAKVISVGNITLGGTGKTPLVEFLTRYITQGGIRRVAILSRGYSEDEPMTLRKNLPQVNVLCSRDRIRNAKLAQARLNIDTFILDDGFQHWRLKRDLDIITINAQNPFGNRHLIPRGTLREPVSALRRANIIMLTKVDLSDKAGVIADELKKIAPSALIVESVYEPSYLYEISLAAGTSMKEYSEAPGGLGLEKKELSFIRGKDICLLSSIGDPDSFRKTIIKLGAKPIFNLSYLDHYRYSEEGMLEIGRLVRDKHIGLIVTTEKDSMRFPRLAIDIEVKILVLRIEVKITKNEKQFLDRISSILAG